MASQRYTHIRVTHETKVALEALRQSWVDNEWQDRPTSDSGRWDCHTSLNEVIRVLIQRVHDHRERRIKSAQKQLGNLIAEIDRATGHP